MLLSRVLVIKFEVCQHCFVLFRVYVMKFGNTADIPQTSLHKHGTITFIIPDIPQSSLHKHGTITQITPDIHQTSLHKHGTITQITADTPQTSLHKHGNNIKHA
jgi:uncharacterized Rossmann fold enzyme